MRNYTPIKTGSGDGDYAEYLLKKEAIAESADYYVEGQSQAIASVYIGSKAKALGLEGEISLEAGKELLNGKLPDGTKIRHQKTSGEQILGHDNTFSAPKSASVQCASDMRVFDCHVAAVQSAISALEDYCCYQRVQVGGHRSYEKGDGFVGWMTHHWQSREGDIDLHTHVVTANGCEGPDGKWRSIHDTLMSESRWLGNYYRNCYAQNLQEIGYEVREKKLPKDGYSFDIIGYSEQDVDAFSVRRQQIAKARSQGMSDQEAWYKTRKDKDAELSIGELFERTLDQKAALGVVGHENPTAPNENPIGKTDAKKAVDLAIAHLSRSQCKFTESDLLAQVFAHMEQFGLDEVEAAIASNPELVDYGFVKNIELDGVYTTAQSLQRETDIINRWMDGQGQATPIMDIASSNLAIARMEAVYKSEWEASHQTQVAELRAKIESGDTSKKTAVKLKRIESEKFKGLNKGQMGAVQGVLATDNQHSIIYGLSGVGKTRSLKPLKTILDEEKVKSIWLAPSIAAAEVLGSDVGKQAFTAQKLAYTESIKLTKGMVVAIDESGLIDAECMDLIGIKAEKAGARIVLIGDPKQNPPVQAGSPMVSLMYNGAEVFSINEILRQKDPIQKKAVELIAHGDGVGSLKLLDEHGYVREIENAGERQHEIAFEYLRLNKEERKETIVISGTNEERIHTTKAIRDGLKAVGALGESLDCVQLVDARLSPEEQTDIRNYVVGQYLDPLQSYSKARRHEFCKIVGKTETHLVVQNPKGLEFELNPSRWDKRVFNEETINIAINDEIRFKGEIYGDSYRNGQIFTVKGIEGKIATIENARGKVKELDLSRPLPVDHNIVRTTFDAQGSGKDRAILSLTSDRTSNKGSTYVGISRQFNHLSVYTQDYAALLSRVARECTHSNALDLLEISYDHSTSRNNESRNGSVDRDYKSFKHFAGGRSKSIAGNDGQGRGGIKTSDDYETKQRHSVANTRWSAGFDWLNTGANKDFGSSVSQTGQLDNAIKHLTETYFKSERSKNLIPSLQQFGGTIELLQKAQNELGDAIAQRNAIQSSNAEKMAILMGDRPIPTYKVVSDALAEWQELRKTNPKLKAEAVLREALIIKSLPVKKVESFWAPDYSKVQIPDGFKQHHWREVMGSAIHPDLVAGNMEIASGDSVIQKLAKNILEDPTISDFSKENLKEKYEPVVEDGFLLNGGYDIKALSTAKAGDLIPRTDWNVYKSFTPRLDEEKTQKKGKASYRKYENPIGAKREFFMPVVQSSLADAIYKKHGITPTDAERESGLYYVALKYNLPIVITEGAKKTMASLSQGHVTIGMQGVNALYRARDNDGHRLPQRAFNEDFACWATPGRQITFAFDADSKESSIVAVRRALVHSVELLQERGCNVLVAAWHPDQGKGLDDLIVQSGPNTYEKALRTAQSPDAFIDAHYKWEYDRVAAKFTEPTDAKIYDEMMKTNPQDAERVLRQSDAVPSLDLFTLQAIHKIIDNSGRVTDGIEIVEGRRWVLNRDGDRLTVHTASGVKIIEAVGSKTVVNQSTEEIVKHMNRLKEQSIESVVREQVELSLG